MIQILLTASSAHKQIIRSSFYILLLLVLATGIFSSQYMTLFEFGRDLNLMREMALSTIFLWIILCSMLSSNSSITEEIENRITYTILTKPITPTGFVIGKFLGVSSAVFLGILLLASVMFYTLWLKDGRAVADQYGPSMAISFWEHMCNNFFYKEISFFAQILLLSTYTSFIICSISTFCFTLMPQNVAFISVILLVLASQLVHMLLPIGTALPMLIFFQLPTTVSQGELISMKFLFLSTLYLISYIIFILTLNSVLFTKKRL